MSHPTIINKATKKKNHSKKGEFSTAREAAQAKTEDLMKSLEKADLSIFQKK